jgi:hypothetical protein
MMVLFLFESPEDVSLITYGNRSFITSAPANHVAYDVTYSLYNILDRFLLGNSYED